MGIPYLATSANYRLAKRQLEELRDRLPADHADHKIIEGMLSDCNYAIDWLLTGRRPGNKRGIERRAAYQREKLMDPIRMQAFVHRSTAGSPANLSEWQRFQIDVALSKLSERERECYVLAHGECFTHEYIADMLGISKGAVDSFVSRAQKKISAEVQDSIFFSR